jgi:hypothetical protein
MPEKRTACPRSPRRRQSDRSSFMIRGSCLCGGVVFEAAQSLTPILFCHAERCRKATGGAFAPEMLVGCEGFHWVTGEELVSVYQAPLLDVPPAYRRAFCCRCGSPLPVSLEGTPFMVVIAGALDGDPEARPFRHSYVAQKACWHEITDGLPQSAGRPESPPVHLTRLGFEP